ncbi:MAG: nicotinate-nucleotide adenylyltransferase [Acidimicrobiia bacterium]
MRRGILGGTFDPPHLAHLLAGEAAFRELGLDVVTFIPAGAPWQKAGRRVSAAEHRWAMTELAVAGVDYFVADDREVTRDGWTYTIDTLESLPASDELVLVAGADAALGLPTWVRFEDVLARVTVAVMPRPGVDRGAVDDTLGATPHIWLDTPAMDLSGTMLRARARGGRSLRFLVPDAVWAYVEEHALYGPD